MKLYLPGPTGPEQLATKWLLKERGYRCVCATDVASAENPHNAGMKPTDAHFRQVQMLELMSADAVVLDADALRTAQALELLHVCRYAGLRVVRLDELPAQCPSWLREAEILEELDLVQKQHGGDMDVVSMLRRKVLQLYALGQRLAEAFDRRAGWFFTNGMKQYRLQPEPRTYALPNTAPNTTA